MNQTAWLIGLGVGALICGGIGTFIGAPKGRDSAGFWLGLLLGPLGIVVVAVMEPTIEVAARRQSEVAARFAGSERMSLRACPYCAEDIKHAAILCKHCGRDVEARVAPVGPTTLAPPRNDLSGWKSDPTGRYQLRRWDGRRWTPDVRTDGVRAVDPIEETTG